VRVGIIDGRVGVWWQDHNDAVDVVGHDNPGVQPNLGADFGGPSPFRRRHPPVHTEAHLSIDHLTEEATVTVCAGRDEIHAFSGVVVFL